MVNAGSRASPATRDGPAETAVQKLEFAMGMCMECHRKKKVTIDCWKCHY